MGTRSTTSRYIRTATPSVAHHQRPSFDRLGMSRRKPGPGLATSRRNGAASPTPGWRRGVNRLGELKKPPQQTELCPPGRYRAVSGPWKTRGWAEEGKEILCFG